MGLQPDGRRVPNVKFELLRTDKLVLESPPPLSYFYLLSPFVWGRDRHYDTLVRAVNFAPNPPDKVARIHSGDSSDGLHFTIDGEPVIAPGPGPEDRDGCEDPTVAHHEGRYYVYYTGWNQELLVGTLLYAEGPALAQLQKRGPVLPPSDRYLNPKEAEITPCADGTWRLFFEFAEDDRSKIGMASSPHAAGPWSYEEPLFGARPTAWDSFHLSTGPVVLDDPRHPVMFYNGAAINPLRWRIGWVEFDECFSCVTDRCDDFLIGPGPVHGWDTDVAFAASAVAVNGEIWLYYSIADRALVRATLARRR